MTKPTSEVSATAPSAWSPRGRRTRINWSLTMIGLCMFTGSIVTTRVPLGVVGILISLVGLVIEREKFEFPSGAGFYCAFLLWALIGSFNALDPPRAQAEVVERLKFVIIFVVTVNALRTEGQVRGYLLFLVVCFIAYPARGTLQNYFGSGYSMNGRAIWNQNYANPNDLGALCGLTLGVTFAFIAAKQETRLIRMAMAFGSGILLAVMFLTQSRGVFIGLVVGIGSGFVRTMLKNPRIIIIGIVAVVVIAQAVPTKVWDRLSGISKLTSTRTIKDADPEGSAGERFEIQKTAWRISKDHPWFGVGLGNYPIANILYSPKLGARDTHNTYLNLWAEVGIPGLLLWLAFVGAVFKNFYRSLRLVSLPTGGLELIWISRAVVGFFVSGLFGSYSADTMLYLLFGALTASVFVASKHRAELVAKEIRNN